MSHKFVSHCVYTKWKKNIAELSKLLKYINKIKRKILLKILDQHICFLFCIYALKKHFRRPHGWIYRCSKLLNVLINAHCLWACRNLLSLCQLKKWVFVQSTVKERSWEPQTCCSKSLKWMGQRACYFYLTSDYSLLTTEHFLCSPPPPINCSLNYENNYLP